jgi:antitoxin MazE
MLSQLRKIGNSRGIIIPATLLDACELGDEVDLRVEGKTLVIEALKQPRKGWFDNYKPGDDVDAFADLPIDEASEEWQW